MKAAPAPHAADDVRNAIQARIAAIDEQIATARAELHPAAARADTATYDAITRQIASLRNRRQTLSEALAFAESRAAGVRLTDR